MTSLFKILIQKGKENQRTCRNRKAGTGTGWWLRGDLKVLLFASLYFLKLHCILQRKYFFSKKKSVCKLGFNENNCSKRRTILVMSVFRLLPLFLLGASWLWRRKETWRLGKLWNMFNSVDNSKSVNTLVFESHSVCYHLLGGCMK